MCVCVCVCVRVVQKVQHISAFALTSAFLKTILQAACPSLRKFKFLAIAFFCWVTANNFGLSLSLSLYIYIYIHIDSIKSYWFPGVCWLTCNSSLSAITSGRSTRLHPESAQSWCKQVFTGRLTIIMDDRDGWQERERERETDRQTDRQRERERERGNSLLLIRLDYADDDIPKHEFLCLFQIINEMRDFSLLR